jgi:hypothetical protein
LVVAGSTSSFSKNGLLGSIRIIQGWRDPAYQDQLYAEKISPLTGAQSLHCCMLNGLPASRAFDFGVFELNGSYVTDGGDIRYRLSGEFAESIGLIWGQRFPRPDPDHIQLL